MKLILLFLIINISVNVQAEVYRWTDSDGKTHFTDKKPKAAAEDITAAVKKTNIDTSTQEHQKLEGIFRQENDADREYKKQLIQKKQPSPELLQACTDAKKRLSIIDGPVQFIDDKGKMVNVSEAERKIRETSLRKEIEKYCKN